MTRRFLVLFLGLSLAGACGDDDPGGPFSIEVEGQVISARSGAPVAGASVTIGSLFGGSSVQTTTDDEGRFAATVDYLTCEGVSILVDHPDYYSFDVPPDVCPESSRTVELQPLPVSSVIAPQDPSVAAGGTLSFTVQVTFADGAVEENSPALWSIAADAAIPDPAVCGSFPAEGAVSRATYTAPATPPPAECGGSAGQAAVVAAPQVGVEGRMEASDTVVVTVTP